MRNHLKTLPLAFWGVLAAYLVLAGIYAVATPLFEKPDENWHFAMVMYIAENGRLPQNTAEMPDHYARQQANQPPLYYLTLAPIWRILGIDDLTTHFLKQTKANPQARIENPSLTSDNRRLFIQGRCEEGCTQIYVAGAVGRVLSIFYTGLSLIITALAIHRIFPDREALLLIVTALIGFNPQVLHIGSSLSNDSLMILWMSVGFYLIARWLEGERSHRMVVIMGIVAGAALLTKLSAVTLGLVFGLLLIFSSPARLRNIATFGGVSFMVCGWWLIYNAILYGDPTALNAHIRTAPQPPAPETLHEVVSQLPTVVRSFWAEFGWGQILLPANLYSVIIGVIVGSLLLGAVHIARRWQTYSPEQRGFLLAVIAVFLITFALLFRWMMTTQAPHGRLMFPAVLPISLLMAIGLMSLVPERWRSYWTGLLSVGLFLFAVWLPFEIIRPAYAVPEPVAVPQIAFEPLMRFYEPDGGRIGLVDAALVESPDWLYVQLSWQIEQRLSEDYLVFVHALDSNGEIIAQRDTYPGLSNMPFTRLDAGEILHDVYPLPLTGSPIVSLRIGIYRFGDLPNTWVRLEAESDHFSVEDNAVTIPLDAVRVIAQS